MNIRILCDTNTSKGLIKCGEYVELPDDEAKDIAKSGNGDLKACDNEQAEPKATKKKSAK